MAFSYFGAELELLVDVLLGLTNVDDFEGFDFLVLFTTSQAHFVYPEPTAFVRPMIYLIEPQGDVRFDAEFL